MSWETKFLPIGLWWGMYLNIYIYEFILVWRKTTSGERSIFILLYSSNDMWN